ncbi:MAG: 23S rRNA (uridine(2552)-2'-O)-methyltransferase RlmE [Gammaproteobacteria bacterium]|nr:23S rRNA (uridine(2552)-2'-O)-methyltransferase RlmE [Gammaproteobacteria bacterium]
MARSKSSQTWLKEHHDDAYVLQARRDGYRSRAVYKLIEIQHKDQILKPGQFVVDLGAAPGGWSEYAAQFVGAEGNLVAVDLLPIDPIAGAEIMQGDFTEQTVLDQIMARVRGHPLDLVLSDMAPNLSGMDSVDQPKAMYLAELALDLAQEKLIRNGAFVTKLFHGTGFDGYVSTLRQRFRTVKLRKPDASRPRSREIYAVCNGLK